MTLKIFNTLTRNKEEFIPLEPGRVKIYACGVTVYDECHIGHARSAIIFDIIYRYLRHKGYEVTYVRNYTDVDDKIIQRANQESVNPEIVAERYMKAFDRDMESLGILRPDFEPRATAHIPQMIDLVMALETRGYAYDTPDAVYFSVRRFRPYGRLSGQDLEHIESGVRVEPGEYKEDPLDFALWKKSKPGEPEWDSPWGKGRPGWHIECSAMSAYYLGQPFDIHGGGKDLIFPHHENEIAQSEAATGKPFVQYWVHNGWVTRDGAKMSKSLGNITTIREALKTYHPDVLRFYFLSSSYRNDFDFTERGVCDARLGLERIAHVLQDLDEKSKGAIDDPSPRKGAEEELLNFVKTLPGRFEEAMDDDFNTALALSYFHETVRRLNRFMSEEEKTTAAQGILRRAGETLGRLGGILGLFQKGPSKFLAELRQLDRETIDLDEAEILRLVKERSEARKRKAWAEADTIRDQLSAAGIILEDGPGGTTWKKKLDV
ncbi:MAG: cysteine--tRNA ligase [Deltaproteobacteria bacterium]|nr:cysteine--tRNA ligase [Deltaproteobacteria bacterium]